MFIYQMSHYNYYDNLTVISKNQNDFKIKIFYLNETVSFIVCIEHNSNIYKSVINYNDIPFEFISSYNSLIYEFDYEDLYYNSEYYDEEKKNYDLELNNKINNTINSINSKNFFIDYKYNENYKFFPELLNFLCFVIVIDNLKYEFKIPINAELSSNNKINDLKMQIIEIKNTINDLKLKKN